jgi:SulP family sulfate permease
MAVVLIEIAKDYGLNAIWLVGLIAGALQLLAGTLKLGRLITFLPKPVIVGFSNAIGIMVIGNALDDFLGLSPKTPVHAGQLPFAEARFIPHFLLDLSHIWQRCFVHNEVNGYALLIGVIALVIAILTPRVTKAVPGQLAAIAVGTALTSALHLPVPLIQDVASIPQGLPSFTIPQLPIGDIAVLFPMAVTVFMLGSLESLLSASVADSMTGERHRPNQELIGQGLANIIVPFFGGIPITGVIARTAINIRAGAETRLSSVVHCFGLMSMLFVLARLAESIPLAALAAILILTGLRLIEREALRSMWLTSKTESFVALGTSIAAVAIDLTAGVLTGLLCACALFIARMSDLKVEPKENDNFSITELPTCKFVRTYVVDGALFFGAAEKLFEQLVIVDDVKAVILRMRAARVIDLTGIEALMSIQRLLAKQHARLVLTELPNQALQMLERSGVLAKIDEANIFQDYRSAVIDVNEKLLSSQCQSCSCEHSKLKSSAPKDCPLRASLIDGSSPMARLIDLHREPKSAPASGITTNKAGLEWLFAIDEPELIPDKLRGTPLEVLLLGQNLGLLDEPESVSPQLVVGMCIDFRKSLIIPKDWAYIIRREGANMEDSEFAIALAISKGVRHMALIAHNDCAMANTGPQRENFVAVLNSVAGWDKKKAQQFFDDHSRSREIGNEIDFVLREAERLEEMFAGVMVVPMLFRVDDDKLYLIYDWLAKYAPSEPIMQRLNLRNTGGFAKPVIPV